jgi:hypothetical protein
MSVPQFCNNLCILCLSRISPADRNDNNKSAPSSFVISSEAINPLKEQYTFVGFLPLVEKTKNVGLNDQKLPFVAMERLVKNSVVELLLPLYIK